MARKKSATPKARKSNPVRSGRRSPARQESAADDLPASYAALLNDIKARIRAAQVKAVLAVNREMIGLYWEIGRDIVERQKAEGWGKSVVDRLATDLQKEFPGESGFSPGNVWRMRAFYLAWTEDARDIASLVSQGDWEKLQQAARELPHPILAQLARELDGSSLPQAAAGIPWFHNVVLVEKLKDPIERLWYAKQTTEQGWSRAILTHQIETDLYRRQGRALTNFDRTIPAPDSDLAQQAFKDPYCVGFLPTMAAAREREYEQGLVARIRDFLLELGLGFAFVGQQVHMEVGGQDFYIDLLFYHFRLRCFVVVDLKNRAFEPEFTGKMNFYLAVVDDKMRHPDDRPSIGLILCKEHNRVIVEYALKDATRPMGVARWELRTSLPEDLKGVLPSPERVAAEMEAGSGEPHE